MNGPQALNGAALSRASASSELGGGPLALRRLGLRFQDDATETDYQDWRIGEIVHGVLVDKTFGILGFYDRSLSGRVREQQCRCI